MIVIGGLLWWSTVSPPAPVSAAAAVSPAPADTLSAGEGLPAQGQPQTLAAPETADASSAAQALPEQDQPGTTAAPSESEDPAAFIAPYEEYVMTQGPHGFSYGHMAVDLHAGKGAAIRSPIAGEVTAFYIDQYGNTTLVIENEVYTVTLMHGLYQVNLGDHLQLGQPVGYESNQGYTLDFQGRPCWGRDCGYHTHLNVFDKRTGQNIDPQTLF